MKKYMHKKNGKVGVIFKEDTQKGTMIIKYDDGTSTAVTTGTFKRWFKEIEVEEPKAEVVEELTDEQYAEVGKEIAEQAKVKAAAAQKKVAKKNAQENAQKAVSKGISRDDIITYILAAGFEYKAPEKRKDVLIYKGKVLVGVVYAGARVTTLYFNTDDTRDELLTLGCEPKESNEKFDYFTKIDTNALQSILPMLEA